MEPQTGYGDCSPASLGPALIARRFGIGRPSVDRPLGKYTISAPMALAMSIKPRLRCFYPIDWPKVSRHRSGDSPRQGP